MGNVKRTPQKKRRQGSIAPGITIAHKFKEGSTQEEALHACASVQMDGKQVKRLRSINYYGLEEALRQVCSFRFENTETGYKSLEALYREALANVDRSRTAPFEPNTGSSAASGAASVASTDASGKAAEDP